MKTANLIRKYANQKGITRNIEIANFIGNQPAITSLWLNGKSIPTDGAIYKIAAKFDVEPKDMLDAAKEDRLAEKFPDAARELNILRETSKNIEYITKNKKEISNYFPLATLPPPDNIQTFITNNPDDSPIKAEKLTCERTSNICNGWHTLININNTWEVVEYKSSLMNELIKFKIIDAK